MSWRRVWISLALFGFSMFFILFQNFTSAYIKGFGQSYVFDNFELPTHSEAVWSLQGASCNQILHKDTADLYPTFGQTVRPGYCGFRTDKQTANTFLRFITHPFDRRDASKVTYQESVDHGKGGSETRGKPTFAFNKPLTGKSLDEGWDLGGDYYSTAENTIRYSFDFRVYNISIFEERLAQSATIAQFHQASKFGDKTCGPYYAGSAPSPGLYMSLNKDNSNLIDFKLSLKLFEDQIPSSLAGSKTNCLGQAPIYGTSGPTRSICEVLVWTESFNKTDVVGKWFSVSIIMKNAKAGTLSFFLGSKESTLDQVKYARRRFVDTTMRLNVSTTLNNCPGQIYLGNYVLGYPDLDATETASRVPLYGLFKAEWLGLKSSATDAEMLQACSLRPDLKQKWLPKIHRLCQGVNGDTWVADRIFEKYGKFINGSYKSNETPPQLITDYDNFRIVQQ